MSALAALPEGDPTGHDIPPEELTTLAALGIGPAQFDDAPALLLALRAAGSALMEEFTRPRMTEEEERELRETTARIVAGAEAVANAAAWDVAVARAAQQEAEQQARIYRGMIHRSGIEQEPRPAPVFSRKAARR